MFKLIRDKIPELAKKENKILNYATAENDELYIALLRNKFAEEASEFLRTGDVTELADVLTVLKALVEAANVSEEDFEKVCQEKLKANGGFEKRYIGFFPDEPQVEATQPAPETAAQD